MSKLRLEIEGLQEEIEKAKSLTSHTREAIKEEVEVPAKKPLPKHERRRVPSPSPPPEPSDAEGHPDSPLSEEDIPVQENGEVSSDGEADKDEENAFDDHIPSPGVPCPYIDFVPLQMDSGNSSSSSKKKKADEKKEEEIKKKTEEKKEVKVEEKKEGEYGEGTGKEEESEEKKNKTSPEKTLKGVMESEHLAEKREDYAEVTVDGENKELRLGEDSEYVMVEEEREKAEEQETEGNALADSECMYTVCVQSMYMYITCCIIRVPLNNF